MSSEKLQDLFYMVLMAGNFLNSVSVRSRTTGGHIYGVRGFEDLDVILKTFDFSFEPQCMVAYIAARARPLMRIYLGVLGSQCRNGTVRVGV